MKQLLALLLFFQIWTLSSQAIIATDTANMSFTAIIVNDMKVSEKWYRRTFGFQPRNDFKIKSRGLYVSNLTLGTNNLELIQLENSVSRDEAVANYDNKPRIQGIFKIGFTVKEFDKWIEWFKELDVKTAGKVVIDNRTNKRMVIILDPDGNRVQLFEK